MNAKQRRKAKKKLTLAYLYHVAPLFDQAADLISEGKVEQAEKELREVADNIRKEFGK